MTASDRERDRPAARTLMLQGTASDVGKSVLTAALCRIFRQDGYRVAPFKSQNMSNNSYVTPDGKEIGRAQGMQADACGIPATTDMNPILLKPTREMASQVVVHGKPYRDLDARTYRESYLPVAEGIVREALGRLRGAYDVVVIEGAGSPAEINLKSRDIVNMRLAGWADAPVLLVADIDRGGVFASIVGTLELLEPHERERVQGIVINKFRGDVSLLKPGLDWLEERIGKPVLGVVPYLPNLGLEDEDSASLDGRSETASAASRPLDIAVPRYPRISNFTDIDALSAEPDVRVRFVTSPEEWGSPDAVVLPGSKNTAEDLAFLRQIGLEAKLLAFAERGGRVAGICGGYQMMGQRLLDPDGVESERPLTPGLGLLPLSTRFEREKRTVRIVGTTAGWPGSGFGAEAGRGARDHEGSAASLIGSGYRPDTGREESCDGPTDAPGAAGGIRADTGLDARAHGGPEERAGNTPAFPVAGYEIHMGVTESEDPGLRPLLQLRNADGTGEAREDGAVSADGRLWGTYVHGIFDNDGFRRFWLNELRRDKGLPPAATEAAYAESRERAFDRLADHVRKHLDMERIYHIVQGGQEHGGAE
ncbi:cobyric acid synthase [Cohnella zeiphila]|uniref:Cobyric acid synthase n=1 Tax=Cohnella zeiphila TaxID=2761120 RepID=A0A7X0VY56_9BACL|nr:cobyric acid synthase [Cohnella zeiphila]MBB6734335.1 cobyric acid synthase [Cohnella zeiphila]